MPRVAEFAHFTAYWTLTGSRASCTVLVLHRKEDLPLLVLLVGRGGFGRWRWRWLHRALLARTSSAWSLSSRNLGVLSFRIFCPGKTFRDHPAVVLLFIQALLADGGAVGRSVPFWVGWVHPNAVKTIMREIKRSHDSHGSACGVRDLRCVASN